MEPNSPSPLERELEGEVLKKIQIHAEVIEIAGEKDLEKGLQKAIDAKDSVGGIIECKTNGLPVGLGEPYFDSIESSLAQIKVGELLSNSGSFIDVRPFISSVRATRGAARPHKTIAAERAKRRL